MTIGERIIKVRVDERLNQVEFSKKLGVSKQVISNYETGIRKPGLDIILKISNTFNISTDYLLGLSEYKTHDAHDVSAFTSHIIDTSTINKLGSLSKEDLNLINTVFLSGGFDTLINSVIRYHNLSDREINEYGELVYGARSQVFKMKKHFDRDDLKKKIVKPLWDEAIIDLLSELDKIDIQKEDE